MLTRLARLGIRRPRRVLAVAGLLFVLAALYGFSAANHLGSGGFRDPHSGSSRADDLMQRRFHAGPANLVVEITLARRAPPGRPPAPRAADRAARSAPRPTPTR